MTCDDGGRGDPLSFPDEGIEAPANMKAQPALASTGFKLGFGYGEAQGGEVAAAQLLSAERNQQLADPLPAEFS